MVQSKAEISKETKNNDYTWDVVIREGMQKEVCSDFENGMEICGRKVAQIFLREKI